MAQSEEEWKSLLMKAKRKVKRLIWNSTFKKLRSWHLVPSIHGKQNGRKVEVTDFIFLGSKITADGDCSPEIKWQLAPWKESNDKASQHTKKQRYHFTDKSPYSQIYGFSSSRVQMWQLNYKESWALKNWCFQIVVLEKTLESPLDCKEIIPVIPKGNQPQIFIGRTDAEVPVFGHLILRADSLEKTLMLGKIEGRRRKGWQRMRWLDGITDSMDMNLKTLGDGEGQRSLACCSPWGCKESDMT